MANNDKIYLAYKGDLGNKFMQETNERINWIIDKIDQEGSVLDIGCSQGIITLLLAEKNTHVLGIDIELESINFAKQLLEEHYSHLNSKVSFKHIDFMNFNSLEKFDYIVITEVLEHLKNPDEFLTKAMTYLKGSGKAIITVPFGINNHPDHYSTFYMSDIYNLVNKYFLISEMNFIGNWTGLVCYSKDSDKVEFKLDNDAIKLLENKFFEINQSYVKRTDELYLDNVKTNNKYKESLTNYEKIKSWNVDLKVKINEITENYNELKEKYQISNENYNKVKAWHSDLKSKYDMMVEEKNIKIQNLEKQVMNYENIKKQHEQEVKLHTNDLLDYYNDLNNGEEFILELKRNIQKLETQNNYLKHENAEYKKKLSKITDTKVGKLGLKFYHVLKKLKLKI